MIGEKHMSMIEDKLKSLGITLPPPVKPVANYVPWVRSGKLVFLSGQLPMFEGKLLAEGLSDQSLDNAVAASRQCAINLITQMRDSADGNLENIARIVQLRGFIASSAAFKDHAKIMNGASDLMVEVFGEIGRHARTTVGVSSLPLGAMVEIEAVVELNG
jgi:enamine deaminase RidA (YjgF/YER057c/UK114 family)